ncbi:homoserine kinase [Alkaliphilus sp. AH-315-G20]|nr:homoserine kinase [Alkaliphilus sp. AH-315-G20]
MIKVRVPATSANIGPGFDTLGMALNIYNMYIFNKAPDGVNFVGIEQKYNNKDNLIYQAIEATWKYLKIESIAIKVEVESEIPISKGLGSSAACIIGGILGAVGMADKSLSNEEILKIAMSIEGHPDNVTPALIGGMTIAICVEKEIEYMKLNIVDQYVFYTFIPKFNISTIEARRILPETVSLKDAVFNVSRASMLIASLMLGKQQFLTLALEDKLHQQYRSQLIDGYDELMEYFKKNHFIGNFISGAGPTVIGIIEKDKFASNLVFRDWTIKKMKIDFEGAKIL